jgi:ABC-2 type transport system permease protein
MVMFKNNLRIFWTSTRASVSTMLADMPLHLFLGVFMPRTILQILFFTYLAKSAGGDSLALFAFIGNLVHTGMSVAIFNMSDTIQGEKWNGTLEYLIAAPANWLPSMLGKSMASYAETFLRTGLACLIMIPLFHLQVTALSLVRCLPIVVVVFLSSSALGWLLGVICMPIRWGNLVLNTFSYTMVILCGINFPFSALPAFVQTIGSLLPVTHGLLAIRAVIAGSSYAGVMPLIWKEVLIGLMYTVIAWYMFGQGIRITRERGSFQLV